MVGKAYYLCDSGVRDRHDLYQAIFTYNHADWYVREVLDQAKLYADTVGTGDCTTIPTATPTALTAITYACKQRGLPYVRGGNGAQDGGFDCSGLTTTTAAYAAAGITLPRTADTQYRAGPTSRPGNPC